MFLLCTADDPKLTGCQLTVYASVAILAHTGVLWISKIADQAVAVVTIDTGCSIGTSVSTNILSACIKEWRAGNGCLAVDSGITIAAHTDVVGAIHCQAFSAVQAWEGSAWVDVLGDD